MADESIVPVLDAHAFNGSWKISIDSESLEQLHVEPKTDAAAVEPPSGVDRGGGVLDFSRVDAQQVALIPSCIECAARWLPADEDRWSAYLTDDEPWRSCSTVRSALSGSPAAEAEPPPAGPLQSADALDQRGDPEPRRHPRAAAGCGVRPSLGVPLESGRSRPAAPRRQIRPEVQVQAEASPPPRSVQYSLPTSVVETVENPVMTADAPRFAAQAASVQRL